MPKSVETSAVACPTTSLPKARKSCARMKQLAQKKRQKSERTVVDGGDGLAQTRRSTK